MITKKNKSYQFSKHIELESQPAKCEALRDKARSYCTLKVTLYNDTTQLAVQKILYRF